MDLRPIGVFDSGSGGLTAVREIRSILPSENIIYFGDTSRVPYGSRSAEILLHFAKQDVRFLRTFDIKALVVACGPVSTPITGGERRPAHAGCGGAVLPPRRGVHAEQAGGAHRHCRLRALRRL